MSAPYGSWKSPITADIVSGSEKRLAGFTVDSNGHLMWLETRPAESGRAVLVKQTGEDVTPKDFNVRTTAQEYGGGSFGVSGHLLVFSNFNDQRLYKQLLSSPDSVPVPITPDYGGPVVRYADGVFDGRLNRWIAVREDHRKVDGQLTTEIISVALNDCAIEEPEVLISGNDFYAFPRVDPKGERLAWIEWSHPNMHWDKAELWVGCISENGDIKKRVVVAGASPSLVESPTEPLWSSKGELFFITDRNTGFWNIYKWIKMRSLQFTLWMLSSQDHFGFLEIDVMTSFREKRNQPLLLAVTGSTASDILVL